MSRYGLPEDKVGDFRGGVDYSAGAIGDRMAAVAAGEIASEKIRLRG